MKYEDVNFINAHLDQFEKNIFFDLKQSEQKHSVRVARLVILILREKNEYNNIKLDRMIKAALLHDVGKSYKKINIIQKVFMVIVNKRFGEKIRRLDRFEFVDCYYNHPDMSYDMLKDHIKDTKILYLLKNHHNKIDGDTELELLRYCDEKS